MELYIPQLLFYVLRYFHYNTENSQPQIIIENQPNNEKPRTVKSAVVGSWLCQVIAVSINQLNRIQLSNEHW